MAGMKFFQEHADWGPAILRIFFGLAFLVAGLDKIMSLPMAKGMFEGLFGTGLGAPMLYLAIAIELLGGLALLFNWHAPCAAIILAVFILVAFVKTFGFNPDAPNFIAVLREIMVMNTAPMKNTAVNLAYLAGLLSLAFSGCKTCKKK